MHEDYIINNNNHFNFNAVNAMELVNKKYGFVEMSICILSSYCG